jgi:hypothetical protein
VTEVSDAAEIEEKIARVADELLGPSEIYEALEAWGQIAELLPDDDATTSHVMFATGSNA